MRNYVIRRTAYALLMLLLASTAIFFLLHATPGSPYDRMLAEMDSMGKKLPPETHMGRLYLLMGLDRPIHERYAAWLKAVAAGDLGATWTVSAGHSVARVVMARVPYTSLLMLAATLLALIVAFPLGLYSALHPYTDTDLTVTMLSFFGLAMPSFWFGVMLISIFSLSNAIIPLITVQGLDVPALFTGAIITEVVFTWPGIGTLYMSGLRGANWPLLQGLLLINTLLIIFANLFADIAYSIADPRIRQ